ncbi:MAG: hypothetical protein NT028_07550 [candidate division Zixibacteria bacterium]|nr:hypothetical protein [candidate division Zixibacteria bacterium]
MSEYSQYPWYAVVPSTMKLVQGDLVLSCPIFVPSDPSTVGEDVIPGEIVDYDVIVMSQSCDLEYNKIELVLVCPVHTLDEFAEENPAYRDPNQKEAIRRGYVAGLHLLNQCAHSSFESKFLVVDFRNVYGVQYGFLKEFVAKAGDRVRLLPPYREHLSQSFARFFMRVGLPLDIPPFNGKKTN